MALPEIADYCVHIPHLKPRKEPDFSWFAWRGHRIQGLRRRSPQAPVRVLVLVLHGAGAHSRALWPIAELFDPAVAELSAVNLPLYGATTSPAPDTLTYREWLEWRWRHEPGWSLRWWPLACLIPGIPAPWRR